MIWCFIDLKFLLQISMATDSFFNESKQETTDERDFQEKDKYFSLDLIR